MNINSFIESLSETEETQFFENPYKNETQRYNLEVYLNAMYEIGPKTLFVGEAPGYKGCYLSGIPFTSEYQLLNDKYIPGYGKYKTNGLSKEKTATIFWNAIKKYKEYDFMPLLWNSFPFHPYVFGNKESNRAPSKTETDMGAIYIKKLIDIFDIKYIYSIGKSAYSSLIKMNIDNFNNSSYIRHPSYGGKADFNKKIDEIVLL